MSQALDEKSSGPVEGLHVAALSLGALGLALGVMARRPLWVNTAVSLVLLLPPLRLATTILAEARARRYRVAALGVAVLAVLLFSRRIS